MDMLEVEMKFPVRDFAALVRTLTAWGATPGDPLAETDHYLNAPDRDFARTDEALRVRCCGDANFVTYKGPKRDAQTKTRTEVEVSLAPGADVRDAFIRLLQHLGYRPVGVVRKTRHIYRAERDGFALEVCLDDVAGL